MKIRLHAHDPLVGKTAIIDVPEAHVRIVPIIDVPLPMARRTWPIPGSTLLGPAERVEATAEAELESGQPSER